MITCRSLGSRSTSRTRSPRRRRATAAPTFRAALKRTALNRSHIMPEIKRVLLTGATGFVGLHLYPVLAAAGMHVVCGSRHPEAARARFPSRDFRKLNV